MGSLTWMRCQVMGVLALPLDGDHRRSVALIAHGATVRDVCVSPDGRHVFTCGGPDRTVKMWALDQSLLRNIAKVCTSCRWQPRTV
jgi:WD40 repeat protein